MVDLTAEMAGLWTALGAAPVHRGRLILFTSGRSGEGVSTVSREFSRLAAARAHKPVWLVDADLEQQGQVAAMCEEPHRFGRAGDPVVGSPDGSCFFAVLPGVVGINNTMIRPARFLSARPFLGRRLYTTLYHSESVGGGQRAITLGQVDYWAALSKHSETIIIDAPSGDRSDAALTLAPFADAVVMVINQGADVSDHLLFKEQLIAAGGKVVGLVLNRADYAPPKVLSKLMG